MINKSKLNELLRVNGFYDGYVDLVVCDGDHNSFVVWFDEPSGLYQVIQHLGENEINVMDDFSNRQEAAALIFENV